MTLLSICAQALAGTMIAVPAEFAGESTLAEIASYLESEYKVVIEAGPSIKDKPLFFHWVPQPEEQLIRGLASTLDLVAAKDEETGKWTLKGRAGNSAASEQQRLEQYIDAVMAFRLNLLPMTDDEVAAARREREPNSVAVELDKLAPRASQQSFATFPNERPTLTVISRLSRSGFGKDFTKPFEPTNSMLIDRNAITSIPGLFDRNWALLYPDETIGEPFVLLIPSLVASQYSYELLDVYANVDRHLGSVRIPKLQEMGRFEASLLVPGYEIRVEPKPMYSPHSGRGFEILPDLFKQIKHSFAVWCPVGPQALPWSSLGSRVCVNDLVLSTRMPPAKGQTVETYQIAFEAKDGWTRVKHAGAPAATLAETPNWTRVLPFLRRLRKGQVDLAELLTFVDSLSEAEARGISNAALVRRNMSLVDMQFTQAVFLFRCLSQLKEELEGLEAGRDIRIKIADLPTRARRSLESYLLTSRFWPSSAHFQHPGFPKRLLNHHLFMRKEVVNGETCLFMAIEELENESAAVRIPLPKK